MKITFSRKGNKPKLPYKNQRDIFKPLLRPVSTWSSVVLGLETVGFQVPVPPPVHTKDDLEWSLEFQLGLVPRVGDQKAELDPYWRAPARLNHKVVRWSTPIRMIIWLYYSFDLSHWYILRLNLKLYSIVLLNIKMKIYFWWCVSYWYNLSHPPPWKERRGFFH